MNRIKKMDFFDLDDEDIDLDQYSDKEIETLISLENIDLCSIIHEAEEGRLDNELDTNY